MVPQHTRPIAGEMVIMDILTSYRDAIQFVRDQTIRYMNKGLKNVLKNNSIYGSKFIREYFD